MPNNYFSSNRPFRLWDYLVSHDQLLLRSAKIKGYEKNIDIIFFGVTYIQLFTILPGLTIRKVNPSADEVYDRVKEALTHEQSSLFEIVSGDERYLIVALFIKVFENDLEFGESSLGFTGHGREKLVLDI